jgi:transcriptional regulator with XRE-family HTH domain
MNIKLSQKQIGNRVATLRKLRGLSQGDLSKSVNISKPSLAQIELGSRSLDILELQRISIVMGFSLYEFFSNDFFKIMEVLKKVEEKSNKIEKNISIPILQVNKFKNVLLYILERCAGKPNVGETVLYRLLYFSDFNYYEIYEEHLTGARYRKMPNGPVPQKIDTIIKQMIDNGQLARVKTEYHDYLLTRFLPLDKPNLREFKATEKEVIGKVIEQMSDWSLATINNYSHEDIPWLASKEGEEISYELALYRYPPYSVRNYGNDFEQQ